jgi:alkanesulfonate monooxygenase SsuD/methylene tetrahydromethanopterin reductase-like flavin-dependent oxidoreductase (luciferase family)
VVAEHSDLWNMPGGNIEDAIRRNAMLDRFCAEIGRDSASVTRSIILPVSYEHPGDTRKAIAEAIDADFPHIVLSLPAPYPERVARWSPTSSSRSRPKGSRRVRGRRRVRRLDPATEATVYSCDPPPPR